MKLVKVKSEDRNTNGYVYVNPQAITYIKHYGSNMWAVFLGETNGGSGPRYLYISREDLLKIAAAGNIEFIE